MMVIVVGLRPGRNLSKVRKMKMCLKIYQIYSLPCPHIIFANILKYDKATHAETYISK